MSDDSHYDPLFPASQDQAGAQAVALIRAKVARAFGSEPDAMQELAEANADRTPSKHQRYMQQLSASGKSLAEIQTEWHHYYTTLTDAEKHEVWQEFYAANQHTPYQKLFQKQPAAKFEPAPAAALPPAGNVVAAAAPTMPAYIPPAAFKPASKTSSRKLKSKLTSHLTAGGKLTAKHHLQSVGFGLLTGSVVLVVFLFTFFNEYVIAPFIQPSRSVSNTPIILGTSTAAADAPPSVTVPKINIQIPINYTVSSYDETVIDNGLKSGAIHYPNTVLPGQNGNGAYFGHSSGNIFNNGKYKFAFTLLHDLTTGDLFYITYNGTTYAYRIFDRAVVPPDDVAVINDTRGKQATAELITCDPPGISTNRLVIWGEQISPSPSANTPATPDSAAGQPTQLASNGPTLWDNFVSKLEFWK